MATLYKYTTSEYLKSCIENGIYASQLDKINDPYEARDVQYQDRYRVVCMTSSRLQILMWAYYGNHKGCCVGFDVSGIDGIRQVKYVRDFFSREEMNTDEVIESLYCKGSEWEHEKEYRLVYHYGTSDERIWKHDGDKIFLMAPVKSITFGYASEVDYKYLETLEYLKEYNRIHKPGIEISKCKLSGAEYKFIADKQFDIDAEIEKAKADTRPKFKIERWNGAYRIEDETFVMLND